MNKPTGWTSHDCVAQIRRLLRQKRIGHAGTLDPAATGVLPIALGRATRLLQYLSGDKMYHATIRFGIRTQTDDLDGDIIATQSALSLNLEDVQTHLAAFHGTIQQLPPQFSAIQVQGQRLYDLARSGQRVEVPERTVVVHSLEILDWRSQEYPELDVAIACGAGTYIRSIARDLGDRLGVGGTLANLIRTESSGFFLTASLSLEHLEHQVQTGKFEAIAPDDALRHIPTLTLPPEIVRRWCQGQRIAYAEHDGKVDVYRIHNDQGRFCGIGQITGSDGDWVLRPRVVYEPIDRMA